MKTTDLIPILLYHLKEGDKYGLELVEACKNCSDGRIEIKQPSLYSVLKKLEKSHFISSYWKDSDIGGKRHYYKITENGLLQLDTYPPLDELVRLALINTDEEIDDISSTNSNLEIENKTEKKESSSSFDFTFDSIGEIALENEFKDNKNDDLFKDNLTENQSKDEEKIQNIPFDNIITNEQDNSPVSEEISNQIEQDNSVNIGETISQENDMSSISFDINSIKSGEVELSNSILTINERKNDQPIKNDFDIFDAISFNDNIEEDNSPTLPPQEKLEEEIKQEVTEKIENVNLEETHAFKQNETSINKNSNIDNKKEIVSNKNQTEKVETEIIKPANQAQEIRNNVESVIKYSDYEDFSTSPKIINAKRIAKQNLIRNIFSSSLAILIVIATLFISIKTNITTTYIIYTLLFTLYIVYNFCRCIGNYHKNYLRLVNENNINNNKILIRKIIIFVANLVVLLVINLAFIKDSLFKVNYFGNFLYPILETSYFLFDYLIMIICSKSKKTVKI